MRLRTAGLAVAGALAGAGAAIAAGTARWNSTTSRLVGELAEFSKSENPSCANVTPDQYAELPVPVRRYFEYALEPRQRPILTARLHQHGCMRADERSAWALFTAVEHFATKPVGFIWDAKLKMMPLLALKIRDGYVRGAGTSGASALGFIPLGKRVGAAEVASASLMRYLAESAWLPTALLPRSGVRWTAIDDAHARASLTDSGTTVAMDVTFASDGPLLGISALRYRDVSGTAVLTPWSGSYSQYERIDGMMIPRAAEVAWSPPSGTFTVWRGEMVRAEYSFEQP